MTPANSSHSTADNLDITNKVLLAPMAGVTDAVFRKICCQHGADLAFTEMVSAKGLSYANEKTRHIVDLYPGETQVGAQIFGHEPDVMAEQARWLEDTLKDKLVVIDINMGCPARKIVSKGDGSALMRDPHLASAIVKAVTQAVNTPVSVKFRRGYTEGCDTAPEFAKYMEDAGASWICVHGRYAEQLYRGQSCLDTIARVKQVVSIPVIGNGDIKNGADALNMLKETNCDSIMIARAAEGNPWIFEEVKLNIAADHEGVPCDFRPPSAIQRIEAARHHARELDKSNKRSLVRMRKHAAWYIHGLPGASFVRGQLSKCTTLDDFENVLDELKNYLEAKGHITYSS